MAQARRRWYAARFVAVVALADSGDLVKVFRGIVDGEGDIFGLYEPDTAHPPTPVASLRQHALVFMSLSNREAQVAQLLVDGLSNKEIATALGIADITVRLHLRRVFSKLGARSREFISVLAP